MKRADFSDVVARVRQSVQTSASVGLEEFIVRNLRLRGRHISFRKREYQQRILQSDARTLVVKKCSQIGISELMMLPFAQGVVEDGGYGGEFAGDAGGLHFLQAAVAPFGKVVRHDFGGFNVADGVA